MSAGTGGVFLNGLAAATAGNLQICIRSATRQLYIGQSATSCNPSSERFKTDISTLQSELGLDAVRRLRPVSYTYIDTDIRALGFIAEEVNQIDSRPVVFDELGRPKALDYDQFIPMLTKGVQEIDARVSALESASSSAALASITDASVTLRIGEALDQFVQKTVTFWGKVIFRNDVFFAGRPTFNSDTAGFAQITNGSKEVTVSFDKEYATQPIIVASPDRPVLFAVQSASTKGFTIMLSTPAASDIRFSWTATAVQDAKTTVSGQPSPAPSPSPAPVESAQPSPVTESTPTPAPSESPTPSPSPEPTPTEQGTISLSPSPVASTAAEPGASE
jgi:cell division septation protein DedD